MMTLEIINQGIQVLKKELSYLNHTDRQLAEQELAQLQKIEKFHRSPEKPFLKHIEKCQNCMAFDKKNCKGDIVKAHGISKKHLLNISNQGHVLAIDHSPYYDSTLKSIGLRNASTFTGFCERHDNTLFQSFEHNTFIGSYEQIYACTFRALSKQYFELKYQFYGYSNTLYQGLANLFGEKYISSKKYFDDISIPKHISNHEFLYNEYRNLEQRGLLYVVLKTSKLPISASGVFYEFTNPDHGIIYYVLTEENVSYVILATIEGVYKTGQALLKRFNNTNINNLNCLLSVFMQISDNVYIDPTWFNALENNFKNMITALICRQVQAEDVRIGREIPIFNILQYINIHSFEVDTCGFV